MAILMQIDLVGVKKEQYDALSARVESGEIPADGCLAHAAIVTGDGVRVVDLWESQAAMDTFTAKMMPAAQELGFPEGSTAPQVSEVHNYWIPGA
ncbi:hypothetical protein [Embleya sp. NBC_00896]|uniref:hypothetical protein n=1 Tax=Embleya sp. NBC_00896 TaxID=2975961 RepID=UPI002F90AB18|nr:hypothetical protein OG928_41975 [Embleya sp. NBC_00896]